MNIRLYTENELKTLVGIGRKTYFDTFSRFNTPETMSAYLDEAFDKNKIAGEVANPGSFFYFCEIEKSIAAYFKLNLPPYQSDRNEPDSLELERIYVIRDFKGIGLGRKIIEFTETFAVENGCKKIWLGVWEKNSSALEFYAKMGFEKCGEHYFRMGEELQTDYILEKYL